MRAAVLLLAALVRAQMADRPLFYNLGDESGVADLAAPWDYDLAPSSLAAFHAWLRRGYGTLDALNAQWGMAYVDWDAVRPELTDAAMRRTDGNFSAWSDFKAFMDVAFANAVRAGTDAVHRADPAGLAALEGAQVPGWGGYDYGRLAPAVDVMEIYDTGNALELTHAFNPALIPLGTAFSTGPREVHRAWREGVRPVSGAVARPGAGPGRRHCPHRPGWSIARSRSRRAAGVAGCCRRGFAIRGRARWAGRRRRRPSARRCISAGR